MSTLDSDVLFWPGALDSDVPMGPTPPYEILTPSPLDPVLVGIQRLLQQFRGQQHPVIQGMVAAPLVEVKRLEDVVWTLLVACHLSNAQGYWLDEWGEIFDFPRLGWDDDRYRQLLYAQLYALRSSGTIPDLYRVLLQLDPSWVGLLDELDELGPEVDPAAFRLTWLEPYLTKGVAELYRRFLCRSRAAGVKVWFYWYPRAPSGLFRFSSTPGVIETSATQGFGRGHFAGTRIAR